VRHLRVIRNLRIVEAHGTRSDDGCGDRRVLEAREASNVGVGEGGTGGIRRRLPVFLLSAYAKNRKANLSKAERNALKRLVPALMAGYRRRV